MSVPLLYDLINPQEPRAVEREVIEPLIEIDPAFDPTRLRRAYADTILVFQGKYPGYAASDAWYHDLEHTSSVFVCMAGMIHGAHREGLPISPRGKEIGLIAALFHDIGLIRRAGEGEGGTGAQFTVGHEQRSIAFMSEYFAGHGFAPEDTVDGAHLIACTILDRKLAEVPFRSEEMHMLGSMLGSADLIAQMADRAYLEKLLLLYREFREARLPGYGNELELLEKTPGFYDRVVRNRLHDTLENVGALLETHARERWHLDSDPYRESIERNLEYLDSILHRDKERYRQFLRRGGIADRLPPT